MKLNRVAAFFPMILTEKEKRCSLNRRRRVFLSEISAVVPAGVKMT
jgi:hypothetical protein